MNEKLFEIEIIKNKVIEIKLHVMGSITLPSS